MQFSLKYVRHVLAVAGAAGAALVMPLWLPAAAADSPAVPHSAAAVRSVAAAQANVDWPYYGNDLANTRFQDLDQINPSNVASLQPAWVFHTGVLDSAASFEDSPIVVGGTMFITTGHDDVFAINAATGAQEWAYHPADMPSLSQLSICCGRDNRGVAYGDGMVFLARLDATLVALNASTGAVAWQTSVASWQSGYTMTLAPQFADDEVIVGLSGGEYETRGAVLAYNARTGSLRWRFDTTAPGATWQGTSWETGGAPVWTTPAVDASLGLAYVTTGNAAPDLYGGSRAGQNLYASSLIALNLSTGRLKWAFQEVHHDLWDYDGPQAPMLFNVSLNGRRYPAVGHCNKDGNYFILNRVTGSPLFPVKEVPVATQPSWQDPWPTQPVSTVQPLTPLAIGPVGSGVTAAPEFTPPQQQLLAMQPGGAGGCQWPTAAYSPRTGDVYYDGRYFPFGYTSSPGSTNDEGSGISAPLPGVQNYSVIGATSTSTGKTAWSITTSLNDSSLSVAGNLLFYGENDGVFHAVSAATGVPLWSFDGTTVTDGGGANAPSVTYEVNGREYVVEAFGGSFNERYSTNSPVGDAVIAFALPTSSPPR